MALPFCGRLSVISAHWPPPRFFSWYRTVASNFNLHSAGTRILRQITTPPAAIGCRHTASSRAYASGNQGNGFCKGIVKGESYGSGDGVSSCGPCARSSAEVFQAASCRILLLEAGNRLLQDFGSGGVLQAGDGSHLVYVHAKVRIDAQQQIRHALGTSIILYQPFHQLDAGAPDSLFQRLGAGE